MPSGELPSEYAVALIVAEYNSLRDEILKLIELQSQLIGLAVLALGVIMGVGLRSSNAAVMFVYPPLSLMLSITWLNHAHAVSRCADYLSDELEPRWGHAVLGWEGFVRRHPLPHAMLGYWGVRSVFIGSSVIAVLVGWSLIETRASAVVAGVLSTTTAVLTILLFLCWSEPSPRALQRAASQQDDIDASNHTA